MPQADSLTIRLASPSDATELARLEARAFTAERISLRSFRRLIARAPSAIVLLAEAEGRIAGYAMILLRRSSTLARLYSIGADPASAGRGVGRELLLRCEAEAAARGRDRLRLEVSRKNARALALYRRAGYREFGMHPNYYADGSDALRLEKRLDGGAAGAWSS